MSVLLPTKSPDKGIRRIVKEECSNQYFGKTSMIIQILLVWSLVVMEFSLKSLTRLHSPSVHIFWIMAYSDISKTVKTEQN